MKLLICLLLLVPVANKNDVSRPVFETTSISDRYVLVDVASVPGTPNRRLTFRDTIDSSITHVAVDVDFAKLHSRGLELAKDLLVENSNRAGAMTSARLVDWNPEFELLLAISFQKLENGTIEIKVLPTYSKANMRCGAASPETWRSNGNSLEKIQSCAGWYLLIF